MTGATHYLIFILAGASVIRFPDIACGKLNSPCHSNTMIYFKQQPADRQIGKRLKQLTEPWWCQWIYKRQYRQMFAPADYVYDGASIPRIAWSILGIAPSGPIDAAALAHDISYRAMGGLKPDALKGCQILNLDGTPITISRRETDWLFKTFGTYAGIPKHRMGIATGFVRAFGNKHWGGPSPYED